MICIAALARTEMALPIPCCQNVQGMPQQSCLGDKRQWQLHEAQRKRHQVSLLATSLCSARMYELSIMFCCRDCPMLLQMIPDLQATMSKALVA